MVYFSGVSITNAKMVGDLCPFNARNSVVYRVLKPKDRYPEATREQVLKAAQEWVSLRGIERIFNICRQTVVKWIRVYLKQLPVVADTLL